MIEIFDQPAVKVSELSKVYKLYKKPADRLKEILFKKKYHQLFAALDNISFDVQKGECLGIIGENGAGKSTLLKIMAQTLTPSKGQLSLNGRTGFLLELGAGFHPDLSGRQNYYMAAALLGFSKQEIKEMEERILDFAEIGAFIDQPIKTYSSGMAVRLGFAIATNINPDILIIDEALSVGDDYFQKKSMDKMRAFREQGKTIVFCSHSLYHINLLCDRALWLKDGKTRLLGDAENVTQAYGNYQREQQAKLNAVKKQEGLTEAESPTKRISKIELQGTDGCLVLKHHDDLIIDIHTTSDNHERYSLGVGIHRNDNVEVTIVNLRTIKNLLIEGRGINKTRVTFPKVPLLKGKYRVIVYLIDEHSMHIYDKQFSKEFEINQHSNYLSEFGMVHMSVQV